jgi:glycosidase
MLMLLSLRGTPVLYYGDEIGMVDTRGLHGCPCPAAMRDEPKAAGIWFLEHLRDLRPRAARGR